MKLDCATTCRKGLTFFIACGALLFLSLAFSAVAAYVISDSTPLSLGQAIGIVAGCVTAVILACIAVGAFGAWTLSPETRGRVVHDLLHIPLLADVEELPTQN